MLQKRIRKYTFQLNSGRMLISVLWVGLVIEVTELLQELVIGLSKLQPVQSIARVRGQLNCREISSALRHGIKTHRIMCPYSSMDSHSGSDYPMYMANRAAEPAERVVLPWMYNDSPRIRPRGPIPCNPQVGAAGYRSSVGRADGSAAAFRSGLD